MRYMIFKKLNVLERLHKHTHTQMFALCCLSNGEADMIAT